MSSQSGEGNKDSGKVTSSTIHDGQNESTTHDGQSELLNRKRKSPNDPDNNNNHPELPVMMRSQEGEIYHPHDTNKQVEDERAGDDTKDNENPSTKKPRLKWTEELCEKFNFVVEQLGIENAVPMKIHALMGVEGLTRNHVASHLQKYKKKLQEKNNDRPAQAMVKCLQNVPRPTGTSSSNAQRQPPMSTESDQSLHDFYSPLEILHPDQFLHDFHCPFENLHPRGLPVVQNEDSLHPTISTHHRFELIHGRQWPMNYVPESDHQSLPSPSFSNASGMFDVQHGQLPQFHQNGWHMHDNPSSSQTGHFASPDFTDRRMPVIANNTLSYPPIIRTYPSGNASPYLRYQQQNLNCNGFVPSVGQAGMRISISRVSSFPSPKVFSGSACNAPLHPTRNLSDQNGNEPIYVQNGYSVPVQIHQEHDPSSSCPVHSNSNVVVPSAESFRQNGPHLAFKEIFNKISANGRSSPKSASLSLQEDELAHIFAEYENEYLENVIPSPVFK
ncbi:hypothetical protein Drorol1_Dr00015942 [Drosera rotundifolia]